MGDRPWWAHVLQWSLWLGTMLLLARWLGRARKPAEVEGGASVLCHTRALLVVAVILTMVFVLGGILALTHSKPEQRRMAIFMVLLIVVSALMVIETLRVRHEVSEGGIAYRGLFVTYPQIPWAQIRKARWGDVTKMLTLTTHDGRALRFSGMLRGIDVLARHLEEHVPELEANEVTATMLSKAAEGKLPGVLL